MLASPDCVATILDAIFPPENIPEVSQASQVSPPPSKTDKHDKGKKGKESGGVVVEKDGGGFRWTTLVKYAWLGFMLTALHTIWHSPNVTNLRHDLVHARCGVVWCGVVWCGVVWCDVMRCDVM